MAATTSTKRKKSHQQQCLAKTIQHLSNRLPDTTTPPVYPLIGGYTGSGWEPGTKRYDKNATPISFALSRAQYRLIIEFIYFNY